MNSFSFYMPERSLCHLAFQCHSFFLSALQRSGSTTLWLALFLSMTLPSSYFCFCVYNVSLPFGCFYDFLFITGFNSSDQEVPLCSFLRISCTWGSLRFLYLCIYSFQQVQNFDHYSFRYFFWSPLFLRLYILEVFPLLTDSLLIFSFFLLFHFKQLLLLSSSSLIFLLYCSSRHWHCSFHLQKFNSSIFISLPSSTFAQTEAFLNITARVVLLKCNMLLPGSQLPTGVLSFSGKKPQF